MVTLLEPPGIGNEYSRAGASLLLVALELRWDMKSPIRIRVCNASKFPVAIMNDLTAGSLNELVVLRVNIFSISLRSAMQRM